MAEHLDYVSAMVYPSHWAPGEYGVANPNAQPYDIVQRSLEDFQKDVRGTGARVVPWLQDFSLGVHYGPAQVGAEIQAAQRRRHRRVPALGPAGHVHRRGAATGRAHRRLPEAATAAELAKSLKPNELGVVPVLMHHQIRADGSVYDMTAAQLRGELARLWRDGFYPVTRRRPRRRQARRAEGAVAGRAHLRRRDEQPGRGSCRTGSLDPRSGSGSSRPSRRRTPTSRRPRRSTSRGTPSTATAARRRRRSRWLVEHGFELGNHTKDHIPLNTLGPRRAAAARARQPRASPTCSRATGRGRWRCRSARSRSPSSLAVSGTLGRPVVLASPASSSPAPSRRRRRSRRSGTRRDPADPDEPELERLARLHRGDVARPPRAEPRPALRLGRRPGDDHVPARARVGARAGVPGSREPY